MSAVRSKNTQPELLLRRELHRRGLRYRIHVRSLPGCPDIVFSRAHLAVFVDGDFWHGHGWRERGFECFEDQFATHRDPELWRKKISYNVARDRVVNNQLAQTGWSILRVLESTIRSDIENAVEDVIARLTALSAASPL